MFTGIIQELGIVKILERQRDLLRLGISASFAGSVKIGNSIAVNGVCLTVVKTEGEILSFDAISATLKTANLGSLRLNDRVNLEQALKAEDRLGGHMVTGHIDTTAAIRKKIDQREQAVFEIALDKKFAGNIVKKGSVAIDGVSLTVADVRHDSFAVSIIPHTLRVTSLGFKDAGDAVNVEFDYLGKYANAGANGHSPLRPAEKAITEDFLKEHGFLS